jgi:hypothetical protein
LSLPAEGRQTATLSALGGLCRARQSLAIVWRLLRHFRLLHYIRNDIPRKDEKGVSLRAEGVAI